MTETKEKRVLILDDDKFLLDMYALKFKNLGVTIHAVSKGEEALEILKDDNNWDAIVMDMIMPGLDGLQMIEAIKKDKLIPKSKIIILSNQSDPKDLEKAMELGADGYIVKATAVPSEVVQKVLDIINK